MLEVDWYNQQKPQINDKSKHYRQQKDIFSLDTDYVLNQINLPRFYQREDLGVSMELGIALGVEISRKIIRKH